MKFAICFVVLFSAVFAENLYQETMELIRHEGMKLRNDMIMMFHTEMQMEHTKNEISKELIADLDRILPKLAEANKIITAELAKNPTDVYHKWFLETQRDEYKLLEKEINALEKILKGKKTFYDDAEIADPEPEHPLRHIHEQISRLMREGTQLFSQLMHKMAEFDKILQAERAKTIKDIDAIIPKMRKLQKEVADELAKKPTDDLYLFFLETERDSLKVFEKDLLAFEARMKAHHK